MQTNLKIKKVRTIFFLYWFLLAYIIVALIFWFIELNKQNEDLTEYKLQQTRTDDFFFTQKQNKIYQDKKRKTTQYIGEGGTFLLLIVAGAVFVFRAVRRQFRQSQQQQNFMMAVTHELKTPIAVTKLNLETLQKHKLPPEQQQRLITNTVQEANRLNDLCNNMLLATQMEAGGYQETNEEIDLGKIVNECVNDYTLRYPQKKIITSLQNEIFITGDMLLLQMAVNNLLDNAVKYSPKESVINVQLKKENEQIKLYVIDEGNGIPDEEKKKVFNKFYRIGNQHTKGARGTGLGLYLTKKIAEKYKGKIAVTNNHPSGSNFEISFKQ
jgi:K+-sensing histidine kinase KdpD